ncbi:hypothetical protein DSO57_1035935 [Entomophthora muscae]|uniref:Uncharacterized protein n=1 Tax=Entomophthora muscae TaxID=34485 RepID=A0ACC2SZK9_9FUNG|nr:hypothetical protein DSO57_1035935 [Entomophthora muscae]
MMVYNHNPFSTVHPMTPFKYILALSALLGIDASPLLRRSLISGITDYIFDVNALVNSVTNKAAEITATKAQTGNGYPNPHSNMNSDLKYNYETSKPNASECQLNCTLNGTKKS